MRACFILFFVAFCTGCLHPHQSFLRDGSVPVNCIKSMNRYGCNFKISPAPCKRTIVTYVAGCEIIGEPSK